MGIGDDIKNQAEKWRGKAKEDLGKLSNDQELQDSGKADVAEADLKDAGNKVKDAADDIVEGAKKAFD